MKKVMRISAVFFAAFAISAGVTRVSVRAEENLTNCKAAYVCEYETGTEAYSECPNKRLQIASMCKIMTLLLTFEEIEAGALSYEEEIEISENASGMGGSQVFLQTGLRYPVAELMKSVIVCSANDSCVALAERICGNEVEFVDRMNCRARELGANDTLFANCTGLPKEPQYSCAKDVALMFRELIRFDKYFEFSKIWTEEMRHPDGRNTIMTNTNKLIRFFDGCDGGKTGYTAQAGFCVAATVKRGDMRLISVIIGSDTSNERFESAKNTINYVFSSYENKICLSSKECIEQKVSVKGSAVKELSLIPSCNLTAFLPKNAESCCEVVIETAEEVAAPIRAGDVLGTAILYVDGVEVSRCELLSVSSAEKYTWKEAIDEIIGGWN